MKTALITGITGQDGSYLAQLLLEKGYIVHGFVRRSSSSNLSRIEHLYFNDEFKDRFFIHEGDITDKGSIRIAIERSEPDEIYNLAAMSHVKVSFNMPEYTTETNALGTLKLLETVREINPSIRIYQASTSELFGKTQTTPQNEKTPFYPCSPYGFSKIYAYWAIVNYREAYGFFACNGILFNHESPRRGEAFVSRKISLSVARIKIGLQKKLTLGNLEARRDWGYAPDFVEGMWKMLQQEIPEDFVLATGQTHSVREFVEMAFFEIGIEILWEGKGIDEKGLNKETGEIIVDLSTEFFRPRDVDFLLGDATKAKEKLGWTSKTSIENLVSIMIEADLEHVQLSLSKKKEKVFSYQPELRV